MQRPPSCAHWLDPFLILIGAIAVYALFRSTPLTHVQLAVVVGTAITVMLCALELVRSPALRLPRPPVPLHDVLRAAGEKWVGCMAGFLLVLFGWWASPEFKNSLYLPLFQILPYAAPLAPVITWLCIFYTEWRLGPSEDSVRLTGRFILSGGREKNWPAIRHELLSWGIKFIFFPINFSELAYSFMAFRGKEELLLSLPFQQGFDIIKGIIYALILVAILPGYLFSARLFNNQMRKVDASWFGWMVTLFCYAPLIHGAARWYFYKITLDTLEPWEGLLQNAPAMLYMVGGAILLLEVIHYWGEAIFGVRSSNISNRGIITNGPFRYCKHPIFLSKCLGWLLIWMPFASSGTPLECLRVTLMYLVLCTVFHARCWVEERLLSEDPVYREYGLWMDKHGMLAWLGRRIPFFSFKWRMELWDRKRARNPDAFIG